MATFVLTDADVTINSVDLSDHGVDVAISYESEGKEDTAFQDSTRTFVGGFKNWSMEFQFNQDFGASSVDVTMFPLVGTAVAIAVRADATGIGATNPEYQGTGLITAYNPFPGGDFGEVAKATVSVLAAGTLVRATV